MFRGQNTTAQKPEHSHRGPLYLHAGFRAEVAGSGRMKTINLRNGGLDVIEEGAP